MTSIDLHMHTTISDGTDGPEEIVSHIGEKGITCFSITDHDAVTAAKIIPSYLQASGKHVTFISGVEFSCKDEQGKYHILGYGYDPDQASMQAVVARGHQLRMMKMQERLKELKEKFQVVLQDQQVEELLKLDNPGKPHLARLLVESGYAPDKATAFSKYLNSIHAKSVYLRPEEAIEGILAAGGIPVLAHPLFGSGEESLTVEELSARVARLKKIGISGLEAYYSGFSKMQTEEVLTIASNEKLYVTVGSDYHGRNKKVQLGDTGLPRKTDWPPALLEFLHDVNKYEC